MSEKKGDQQYRKVLDTTNAELRRIYGGKRSEAIRWLGGHSPFWTSLLSYLLIEIDRGAGVLPLSVFRHLNATMLALHRQVFAMWKEREWFALQGKYQPPGPPN
jgi:hypothetical protein